jgi:hypothetical protein
MDTTFGDAIAYYTSSEDHESKFFIEYVLAKYFNDDSFFMRAKEAGQYLEEHDKKMFFTIINRVKPLEI